MASGKKWKKQSLPASVAIGTLTGIVLCVLMTGIAALLMHSGSIKEETGNILAPVVLFLTTATGCITASKTAGKQIALVSGITTVVLTGLFLGGTIFLFNSAFAGFISKLLAILLGCTAASVLCAGKKKKRHYR